MKLSLSVGSGGEPPGPASVQPEAGNVLDSFENVKLCKVVLKNKLIIGFSAALSKQSW